MNAHKSLLGSETERGDDQDNAAHTEVEIGGIIEKA